MVNFNFSKDGLSQRAILIYYYLLDRSNANRSVIVRKIEIIALSNFNND